ncbi:Peptidase S41 family protein [Lachnellula suecica]|uniref:Peptidase S41 family protein n=1 Tax=Lachnellula suecica TaxID=602035 RepID=A0A8T9BY19_9HELO|nr:Peptidase S41 family protein [Lachnellula suecica]
MRGVWSYVATAALACSASAQMSTSANNATVTTSSSPSQTSLQPCGMISASAAAYASANFNFPLDKERSLGFIEYISPFIEFTSTLAYLKNPPKGWTLPGVDIYAGLTELSDNIKSGAYRNQYSFEKDIYTLINVLPRDFHMVLSLPLISDIFDFGRKFPISSVSLDGESLPQPYSTLDLSLFLKYGPFKDWTPSPITTIDGEPAADVLLRLALDTQAFSDADGIYNRLFQGAALASQNTTGAWQTGNLFGLNDNTTYGFANGSTISMLNIGALNTGVDLEGVNSGEDLFEKFEIPRTTSSSDSAATSTSSASAVTSLPGYPKPVVIHPEGYVSGYFLENSSVAVLAINGFLDKEENVASDPVQQAVIRKFLAACQTAGKTKLIIDLQGNGGGSVPNGFDAFKQLFPSIEPFGATRFRSTPLVQYFSDVYTTSGVYNLTNQTLYQTQSLVDVNLKSFADYKDFVGPQLIYGDNFTALNRYNFSDPVETLGNDIIVSGYYNDTNLPAQVFAAENMILLHDGGCGSTCAVFAELMKSQGGVRSIAVGGRPQNGPMQGVTGSKGAQVQSYASIIQMITDIPELAGVYERMGKTIPELDIPDQFKVSVGESPLGPSQLVGSGGGAINLRNNFHSSDATECPLQFIYEAANCRLFYKPLDVFEISNLWERVANVTWNGGKCVQGSSIDSDNTLPKGAYDTVEVRPSAMPNVTMSFQPPGVVTNTGGKNDSGSNTSSPATSSPTSGTASLSLSMALLIGVIGGALLI